MRLRRADCGHLVPADQEPNATIVDPLHGERAGYACAACIEAARPGPRRVETKDVRPEVGGFQPQADPPPPPPLEFPAGLAMDWTEMGREAARAGHDRTLPVALRADHPRGSRPRAWFAGYDQARGARNTKESQ